MATYVIEGIDTNGPNWRLLRGSLYRPGVEVRRTLIEAPHRHGAVSVGPVVFSEPTLALVFFVEGSTEAQLEQRTEALVGLLTRQGDLIVNRTAGARQGVASARLISISEPVYYGASNALELTVLLGIPGVFFRGAVNEATVEFPSSQGFTGVNFLNVSTAPVSDAVMRFAVGSQTGTLGIRVRETRNETGFSVTGLAGSTSPGDFVYVDAGTYEAWAANNGDAWSRSAPGVLPLTGWVEPRLAGMLQIEARAQSNPLVRTTSLEVVGTPSWTIRAAPAFL